MKTSLSRLPSRLQTRPLTRLLPRLAALALLGLACTMPSQAQTKLRLVGLKTGILIPLYHAERAGHFKKEGLDVEFTVLSAGPAAAAAVVSGSAEIGYSASIPVIFARARNQPFKIVTTLSQETGAADGAWTWLVASEKSGINSIRDLTGKTIMYNAAGSLCELEYRDHLKKAGVSWDAVKKIVVPFPQMQAALELGNADSACIIEPFFTSMRVSPNIKARTLAQGMLANLDPKHGVALDVLFVREDWGRKNIDVLKRFHRGLARAIADIRRDPSIRQRMLVEEFKLSPAIASLMKSDVDYTEFEPRLDMFAPILTGMKEHGLLKEPVTAEDLVLRLK
jgi:NitT/TauT family transport system substrate-binding protein